MLERRPSEVARSAYRRGNAAGIHGATKYGKADRRRNREDARKALSEVF